MKKFKILYTAFLAILGVKNLVKDGELNLTEEQKTQLQNALPKMKLEDVVKAMNQELADMANKDEDDTDQQLVDLKKQAMELLKSHGLSQEDAEDAAADPKDALQNASDPGIKKILEGLIDSNKELSEHNKKVDKMLEQLLREPEGDSPLATGNMKNQGTLQHSKTHFLGTNNDWDKFEDRPWNQRAAGIRTTATDWAAEGQVEIQKLKNDIDLYYRKNPSVIESLERDLLGLPAFWQIETGVDDISATASIVSDEISQARKKGWLPKNKQLIQPEENKIFPVHIDIEHEGFDLQQIETSWLNAWNREGSQPFKMSFVRFLLGELVKKARQEDRKVAINGVYVKTPNDATVAGNAINRGDGLLIKLFRAYHYDKKFKIANIGLPTTANIVDYVSKLIEKNMAEEDKTADGKVLYLSPTWFRNYKIKYRATYGMDNAFSKEDVMQIENYPNFRFETLRDLEGSNLMFITDENNIKLMEKVPGEKSMFNFDSLKRQLFIFADYKWGSGFKHIGTKVKDTDPVAFKVQTVWCNIPPYLADTYVPLYDDATGEVSLPYSNITFKPGWATNIDTISNTFAGQVVKIKGDTTITGNVTDVDNISLTGDVDFDLSTGGTLTLIVNDDLTLTELSRTTAPEASDDNAEVDFDTDTIDAELGSVFNYGGAADTLAAIVNGYPGQIITINGAAASPLTVETVAGNIKVTGDVDAVMDADGDTITLVNVDGVWTETERTIA